MHFDGLLEAENFIGGDSTVGTPKVQISRLLRLCKLVKKLRVISLHLFDPLQISIENPFQVRVLIIRVNDGVLVRQIQPLNVDSSCLFEHIVLSNQINSTSHCHRIQV